MGALRRNYTVAEPSWLVEPVCVKERKNQRVDKNMIMVQNATASRCDKKCQVTVAICTYNRPQMLRDMLGTLEKQETDDAIDCEVLVIDNDPILSAKSIFDSCVGTIRFPARYVHEQKIGLSNARNRAIAESRGAVIAFLDDDVLLPPRWLFEMVGTFERTGADCVGGRVLVKWNGSPDEAVKDCEKELVAYDKGERDIHITGRDVPIGANLAFRADVFSDQSLFVTSLGRTRANLMGCEEIELLLRLRKQNRRIWYGAASVVLHQTSGERLTGKYYVRREYWSGMSLAFVDKSQNGWLYCQGKAWVRLGQAIIHYLPFWLVLGPSNRRRVQLLSKCRRRKYIGYWRGIIGVARRPQ